MAKELGLLRRAARCGWGDTGHQKSLIEAQVNDLAVMGSDRRERGNRMDGRARLIRGKAPGHDSIAKIAGLRPDDKIHSTIRGRRNKAVAATGIFPI